MSAKQLRPEQDRRSGRDNRQFTDPNYKGPERRGFKERRSGKDRRKSTE